MTRSGVRSPYSPHLTCRPSHGAAMTRAARFAACPGTSSMRLVGDTIGVAVLGSTLVKWDPARNGHRLGGRVTPQPNAFNQQLQQIQAYGPISIPHSRRCSKVGRRRWHGSRSCMGEPRSNPSIFDSSTKKDHVCPEFQLRISPVRCIQCRCWPLGLAHRNDRFQRKRFRKELVVKVSRFARGEVFRCPSAKNIGYFHSPCLCIATTRFRCCMYRNPVSNSTPE
jgi:hypothetical protein